MGRARRRGTAKLRFGVTSPFVARGAAAQTSTEPPMGTSAISSHASCLESLRVCGVSRGEFCGHFGVKWIKRAVTPASFHG